MDLGDASSMLMAIVMLCTLVRGILSDRKILKDVAGVKEHVERVATTVERVAVETNGMKTELVEEVRKASFAKGVKAEADKH